jgi:cytosine/adenosine deaminase-related metal-dependent hydrolase
MHYRKLKGDKLFDGYRFLENHMLIIREDGFVEGVVLESGHEEMEKLDGILMPGLINSHCHLELSHLKDVIHPVPAWCRFLFRWLRKRGAYEELKEEKIRACGKGTF